MGTKKQEVLNLVEGKGCLGKAAMNEPIFILRAQDYLAPDTINYWISRAKNNNVNQDKIKEAELLVHDMLSWQDKNGTKLPD